MSPSLGAPAWGSMSACVIDNRAAAAVRHEGTLRVALFVTCVNDRCSRDTGRAVSPCSSGWGWRSTSPPRRPAAGSRSSTPATGARPRRWCAGSPAPSPATTRWSCRPARAGVGRATTTRGSRRARPKAATTGSPSAAAGRAEDVRTDRVPGGRARRRGRRRVLPAHGHLPPLLPRRSLLGLGDRPRRLLQAVHGLELRELEGAERMLRLRRHLRREEPRRLRRDGRRQDPPRRRHRRRVLAAPTTPA